MSDIIEFHKTISKEINATRDRVRNLVNHWGEDGRHKEAILKNVIKRFLAKKYIIGTGFVVSECEARGEHKSSKQIDIIIYDSAFNTLFKEGDFMIVTPEGVRGIIEVKTNLGNRSNKKDIINQCSENGKFIFDGKRNKDKEIFNGLFSYEYTDFNNEIINTNITNIIRQSYNSISDQNKDKFVLNCLSMTENYFIKHFTGEETYSLYKLTDLSFSFFIFNLINHITFYDNTEAKYTDNYIHFPKDKEHFLVRDF